MSAEQNPGAGAVTILKVALPTPVPQFFDYRWCGKPGSALPCVGARVKVPFGRSTRIGVIVSLSQRSNVSPERLKSVLEILDASPLLDPELLRILTWASDYYHYPLGEVISATLPAWLRRGRPATAPVRRHWRLTPTGAAVDVNSLGRAPRQAAVLVRLAEHDKPASRSELGLSGSSWGPIFNRLQKKAWVIAEQVEATTRPMVAASKDDAPKQLEPSQKTVVDTIASDAGRFQPYLLHGVTGSGKTEVYLALIEQALTAGKQALVLIPEIGLTPQTVARFAGRLNVRLSVMHSGLSDSERMSAWLMARDGRAGVVIGTRSAILAPLCRPGIFIVDEEHDTSYKQQDGFRYSARDLAVVRAREAGVPVVLGSATPSLESLNNVDDGRYRQLSLPIRAAGAREPTIRVLDVRGRPFSEGLSSELLQALADNLERGEQSLLFLNRRGYAPVLMCHECGWVADCARCDAHMVVHLAAGRLKCHHCGSDRPPPSTCPECEAKVFPRGVGTQRIAEALAARFPDANIARLDRDSTRRKGALEEVLTNIHSHRTDILVGTQMLAKGHHFPNVTFVSVLDADGGLFGADFRATERMAQLVVQVAGRAGRSQRPGHVLIQTHHPDHPLLRELLEHGYHAFATAALAERQAAGLPPYANIALLRAESASSERCFEFLNEARKSAKSWWDQNLSMLGPVTAPMERRAGRYRVQLLVLCQRRRRLQRFLKGWMSDVHLLKSARRVRWAIDVDPQDMI